MKKMDIVGSMESARGKEQHEAAQRPEKPRFSSAIARARNHCPSGWVDEPKKVNYWTPARSRGYMVGFLLILIRNS